METPRHPGRLVGRLVEALKGIAAKLRHKKPPAMVGLPPSARGLTGRPADPSLHAKEVAREWEDVAESYIQERMHSSASPITKSARRPDYQRGGVRRVFLADETIGGSYGTGRRLFVDSGVLNPKLNAEVIGSEASKVWAKARLHDRIEAVIVHGHLEAQGIPHDEVVERAADTNLPISENAQRILRGIAEAVDAEALAEARPSAPHPSSVKRKAASGPLRKPETGYIIPARTSSR